MKLNNEAGDFYWAVLAPERVKSRREEQGSVQCKRHRDSFLPGNCGVLHGSTSTGSGQG